MAMSSMGPEERGGGMAAGAALAGPGLLAAVRWAKEGSPEGRPRVGRPVKGLAGAAAVPEVMLVAVSRFGKRLLLLLGAEVLGRVMRPVAEAGAFFKACRSSASRW